MNASAAAKCTATGFETGSSKLQPKIIYRSWFSRSKTDNPIIVTCRFRESPLSNRFNRMLIEFQTEFPVEWLQSAPHVTDHASTRSHSAGYVPLYQLEE